MNKLDPHNLVDEATFDFTMGDHQAAVDKLQQAIQMEAGYFPAWHALAEIRFDQGQLEEALEAGQMAVSLIEEDVHIHTTLSRIHMEMGDKDSAEKHGARARVLGWKDQLKNDS